MDSQNQKPESGRDFGWKWADTLLVLFCAAVSLLEALTGVVFLAGQTASRWLGVLGVGKALYVLPNPGVVVWLVTLGRPYFSRSAMTMAGAGNLILAGFMAALAVSLARRRRWAYWTYSAVCFVDIFGGVVTLDQMLERKVNWVAPSPNETTVLSLAGLVVAAIGCWYSYERARALKKGAASVREAGGSEESIQRRTISLALIALLLLAVHSAIELHRIDHSEVRYEGLRVALMAGALIGVVLLGAIRRTGRLAASAAVGVGVASVLTLAGAAAIVGPEVLIGIIFWLAGGALRQPEFWVLAAFGASCVVLATVAWGEARQRGFSMVAMAVGAVWVLSIHPATTMLRKHNAERYVLVHELAQGGPYLMWRTESCLLKYKTKQSGRFPATLEEVDQALPGCLQPGMAEGREIGGYRAEYRVKGNAPYAQFSLTAVPRLKAIGSNPTFFADETGIVRTSFDDRPAAATDGGVSPSPAEDLLHIERCIANYTGYIDKANRFGSDVNIGYDAEQMRYPDSFADMAPLQTCFMRDLREGEFWKTAAYRYAYRRIVKDGRENFVLTGRPLQYGVTGLRSYFVDNHFIVHATSEDREAREEDEWAYRCELMSLGTPCADPRLRTRAVTEEDLAADDATGKPLISSTHAGGLAEPGTSKVFWTSPRGVTWVGASEDASREYIGLSGKGILAITSDGRPLWIYPQGETGLAVGGSLYATTELGTVSRINEKGEVVWSLAMSARGTSLQFRNGILYAYGDASLDAISEDGQLLWRMKLPGVGVATTTLSEDGKRLFVLNSKLHAVDVERGKRLWSAENLCPQSTEVCKVEELANGSLAAIEDDAREVKRKVNLRLISASGEVLWSEEHAAQVGNFEYVVPRGTNTIVVSADGVMTAEDSRHKTLWKVQGNWRDLKRSRLPGMFYAKLNGTETLLDERGQPKYKVPAGLADVNTAYDKVQEVGEDLLFVTSEYHTIWTARLPATVTRAEASGRE